MIRRVLRIDVLLSALGALLGVASLGYPFGSDQGLSGYIGWGWLQGKLPYATAFDMKTPGIYLVHAVSIALFGMQMWGVRLFDLLCTMAIGWLAAELAAPRGEQASPATRGAAIFAACLMYFGFFDFWTTGQCESWCSVFALASLLVVHRSLVQPSFFRRAFFAGLLGGISLIFKPPGMWFIGCMVGLLVLRAWQLESTHAARLRRVMLAAGASALGGVLPIALLVLYFQVSHAAGDLFEVLVVNNRHYVLDGGSVHSLVDLRDQLVSALKAASPVGWVIVVALVAVAAGAWRREESGIPAARCSRSC